MEWKQSLVAGKIGVCSQDSHDSYDFLQQLPGTLKGRFLQ